MLNTKHFPLSCEFLNSICLFILFTYIHTHNPFSILQYLYCMSLLLLLLLLLFIILSHKCMCCKCVWLIYTLISPHCFFRCAQFVIHVIVWTFSVIYSYCHVVCVFYLISVKSPCTVHCMHQYMKKKVLKPLVKKVHTGGN